MNEKYFPSFPQLFLLNFFSEKRTIIYTEQEEIKIVFYLVFIHVFISIIPCIYCDSVRLVVLY